MMAKGKQDTSVKVGADTKEAKEKLVGLDKFFENTAKKWENVEKRIEGYKKKAGEWAKSKGLSGVGQAAGAGLKQAGQAAGQFGQQLSAAASDPTKSFSEETAGGTVKGIVEKIPVFGEIAGMLVGVFTDALSEKAKAVEGGARQDVQEIVTKFAKAGIAVDDKDIKDLLDHFRGQNTRVFDSMRQVARVQDQTSNTFMGTIGSYVRRGQDLVM